MDFASTLFAVLENIWAAFAVMLILGFCIFSHELGHFLAARWRKLHVDAFSIGFRKIWSKKVNGVEYRIGWIPFGGYVEIPQVDATDEIPKSADGSELPRAKPVDRMITAVAGPLFNIISGLLVACVVWVTGVPQPTPEMDAIEVRAIESTGPEYQAGLRVGDRIVKVNGEKFRGTWQDFCFATMMAIGRVGLTVERDGKTVEIAYTPKENPNAPDALKHEKIYYPFFQPKIPIKVLPLKNSAAERAGIQRGDILLAVDGRPLSELPAFQMLLNFAGGEPLVFQIERRGEVLDIPVTPEPAPGQTESLYMIGIVFRPDPARPTVADVHPRSPAARAGVRAGDEIFSIGGEKIETPTDMINYIQGHKEQPAILAIRRGGEMIDVTVTPKPVTMNTVGLEIEILAYYSPVRQFVNMLDHSYKSLRGMAVYLANQIGVTDQSSTLKPRHMSGPIGMGNMLFTAVKHTTFATVLYFVVMFSFALAIFNLLPLPVLDGGHITFAVIESILGKPLPTVAIRFLSNTFVVLLISLMVYVTFFDIMRIYYKVSPSEPETAAPAAPVNPSGAEHDPAPASNP